MINTIRAYFKSKLKLTDRVGKLEHQIKLMQEHIQTQKNENISLKKQIRDLEMMWDIETTKRY
jgi:predicted RNase H-like nuclease (RuvC/YqgF family)